MDPGPGVVNGHPEARASPWGAMDGIPHKTGRVLPGRDASPQDVLSFAAHGTSVRHPRGIGLLDWAFAVNRFQATECWCSSGWNGEGEGGAVIA